MRVTLLGYTEAWHTNWYSWNRFAHVFASFGFDVEWTNTPGPADRGRIWICWRRPNAKSLVESGLVQDGDVIFQKLHAFDEETDIDYGPDAEAFLRVWHWPVYASLEQLVDRGYRAYGFGCRTRVEEFPEKRRIVRKLEGRIFWMPYGPAHYTLDELQASRPIMSGFEHDIGYVGSRWGRPGMGNLETMANYLDPLTTTHSSYVAGHFGTEVGQVSEHEERRILSRSRLCPIVHAPFWQAERGVQDRFWSVFAAGRFGVSDNPGVYEFFSPNEVVCATDPEEYRDLSLYFLYNLPLQEPYIDLIQRRIKDDLNFYSSWGNILKKLHIE